MRSKFKKMLTYFLLSAIILPGWVLGSSLFQKPESAEAAVAGDQILDDSAGSPDFVMANPANWTSETTGYNSSSKTTNGTHLAEYAYWDFYADGSGNHLISVSWVVSDDRATNVGYVLLDSSNTPVKDTGGNDSFSVDQTKNAYGQTVANGTWSEYRSLSFFVLDQNEEYSLVIGGDNSEGSVNADSALIVYDSIAPENASVTINSNATYTNSKNVTLNLSATDNLGVQFVGASETTPIPDATVAVTYQDNIDFTLSAGDGPKTVYVQYADLVLNVSPEVFDSIILDTTIATPANVTAGLSGNTITVNWDAILGDLSGIAGYNIYSSSDGFTNKINSSLITATTYNDVIKTNGNYSYKIEAVDNAGNISAKSLASVPVITASNVVPQAPGNVTLTNSGKTLTVSWDAVGGGVAGYIVTINGVSRDAGNVVKYSTELSDYGTYKVLVTSYYSADNFGIDDPAGLNKAKNAATAAGLEKSITIAAATVTSTVSQASVAPEAAVAAETPLVTTQPETTSDEGLQTEEEGKIKGEEESTETTEEKINWTPWIILFVLIILAGAATGGYFYWFSGEEEVETKIKTKPEVEKKEVAKPKAKDTSGKKPRRW